VNCYETIDRMDLALDDRLPSSERPGFDEHLEECGPCRNYFDQLGVTVRSLRGLPQPKEVNARRAELLERFRRSTRPS
jgi:predicted anti-sigma-YlaC factor YlaD